MQDYSRHSNESRIYQPPFPCHWRQEQELHLTFVPAIVVALPALPEHVHSIPVDRVILDTLLSLAVQYRQSFPLVMVVLPFPRVDCIRDIDRYARDFSVRTSATH